jgi:uncharacterized protein (DUF2062 family)
LRVSVVQKLTERARALWTLAVSERASPREIGLAFALGAFVGCSPAIGFHGGLAVGAATILRKNRLFALLGSRVSNFLILPWIVFAEIELAHRGRTGQWMPLRVEEAVDQAPQLLIDWMVGWLVVGAALGAVLGAIAYVVALRRRRPVTETAEAARVTP